MAAAPRATSAMEAVFPESHSTLKAADPEVFGIIEEEKERQWCVPYSPMLIVRGIDRSNIVLRFSECGKPLEFASATILSDLDAVLVNLAGGVQATRSNSPGI